MIWSARSASGAAHVRSTCNWSPRTAVTSNAVTIPPADSTAAGELARRQPVGGDIEADGDRVRRARDQPHAGHCRRPSCPSGPAQIQKCELRRRVSVSRAHGSRGLGEPPVKCELSTAGFGIEGSQFAGLLLGSAPTGRGRSGEPVVEELWRVWCVRLPTRSGIWAAIVAPVGSVLHFVPVPADCEGQKRTDLGGIRIWAGSASDSETIPAQNAGWNESRPERRPMPGRVAHCGRPPASRALRPLWRSADRAHQGAANSSPPRRDGWGPTRNAETGVSARRTTPRTSAPR